MYSLPIMVTSICQAEIPDYSTPVSEYENNEQTETFNESIYIYCYPTTPGKNSLVLFLNSCLYLLFW